ncbi:MAG: zinc-dependent metalloprotease, partial [Candidatus Limnocylindrales bacterium]
DVRRDLPGYRAGRSIGSPGMSKRSTGRGAKGDTGAGFREDSSGRVSGSSRPSWKRDAFLQAGILVGAAIGAAVTVLGRRVEESARRGLVDWDAAERVAVARIGRAPGRLESFELERAAPIYASAMEEIVPALSKALDARLPGVVERSGVIDRETWIHENVATFARLMGKVEKGLLDDVMPPGMGVMKATMAIVNRKVTTRQVGYLLGFLGQRVLGQYDLALLSAEAEPGRLVFLDENIRATASALAVPLNPFRTWIALHETTHAYEFEAHPWLRPYLSSRLEHQLVSLSAGVSVMNREAVGRLRRTLRGASAGEYWMEGFMTAEQKREFREIQAIMSLLEGFGDYVMDDLGKDLVPEVETISAKFHARRAQRTGFERAMMRLTGMDLKMEQYKKGEAFVSAIAGARGAEALRALWRSPETLPSPEEIEMPQRWVARVMPAPGLGAV